MKKILITLSALIIGAFLTSCGPEREYSQNLSERAVIVNTIYNPSVHETHLGTTMMKDYNNPLGGVDMNGNKGIVIGKVNGQHIQISESTIPEQYGIVFQCQHGTFTIQGKNENNTTSKYKVLYDKLRNHVNDTVNIIYKEIYNVTYEKNKEGVKVETKRVLVDLDFIDAQLIK